MSWSAAQYSKFEAERTRPVRDLLRAVPAHDVTTAIDLGCGPGNSTEVLVDMFAKATISGLDNSADMIAAARKRLPKVDFACAALADWQPKQRYDLILSNAVLHWVPDHAALFPRLVSQLTEGGSLAVQMPHNMAQPSHRIMCAIAGSENWSHKLNAEMAHRTLVEDVSWYYELLSPLCARVDIWTTTYYHHLTEGVDGIVEWFKGSALRPFLEALDDQEQSKFLAEYRTKIAEAYPALSDGSVLLPFPRRFIVATR